MEIRVIPVQPDLPETKAILVQPGQPDPPGQPEPLDPRGQPDPPGQRDPLGQPDLLDPREWRVIRDRKEIIIPVQPDRPVPLDRRVHKGYVEYRGLTDRLVHLVQRALPVPRVTKDFKGTKESKDPWVHPERMV